jgi:hypothetical protein
MLEEELWPLAGLEEEDWESEAPVFPARASMPRNAERAKDRRLLNRMKLNPA